MEYFDEVLNRETGQLDTVSKGDWITITELANLYGAGPREGRTVLREMGVLSVEGAASHQRHRLAPWVVHREWGRRIERRGTVPFDVVGPDLRNWISDKWDNVVDLIVSKTTAPSLKARAALAAFSTTRLAGSLTVQQAVTWLVVHHPELTQTEVGMVLNVTQQLVAKYVNIRNKQIKDARALRLMDLDDRQSQRSGSHISDVD